MIVRFATTHDAAILAEHRVAMFREMGAIEASYEAALRDASEAYFAAAIASGEYVGWLACLDDASQPIAGGGAQLRSLLPRPSASGDGLLLGREALVLNVYTAPSWRRKGVARRLMDAIIAWAADAGVVRLVLSASEDGRPLYERMGFVATREMSYSGRLAASGPWTGSDRR